MNNEQWTMSNEHWTMNNEQSSIIHYSWIMKWIMKWTMKWTMNNEQLFIDSLINE